MMTPKHSSLHLVMRNNDLTAIIHFLEDDCCIHHNHPFPLFCPFQNSAKI